jgi:hypothetical protein
MRYPLAVRVREVLMRGSLIAVSCLLVATAHAQDIRSDVRRFALAYLPYAPDGVVDVKVERDATTWAGAYLMATAVRSTSDANGKARPTDQLNMLVDPAKRTVVVGSLAPLQAKGAPVNKDTLPLFAEQGLPQVLEQLLGSRVRVHPPAAPMLPSPLVALTTEVLTGYGWMRLPITFTADAAFVAIGATWPLDRDPREVRRERLSGARIEWDPGHEEAIVKVVEFSDYECPACKRGWEEARPVLASFDDKLHHGMVNFPLVSSHPWAFRAAVAGLCIGQMQSDLLLPLKEYFYGMQDQLTVESLDTAVFAFLDQHGLNAATFRACYMKDPAVDGVLRQIQLGYSLGVLATPTYFADGEQITFSDAGATSKRLQAIVAVGGIPEKVK